MCLSVCVLSANYTSHDSYPSLPSCMFKSLLIAKLKTLLNQCICSDPIPVSRTKTTEKKYNGEINMPSENASKCCNRVVIFVSVQNKTYKAKHISYCEIAAAAIRCCCDQ